MHTKPDSAVATKGTMKVKSRFQKGDIVAVKGTNRKGKVTDVNEWGDVYITFHEVLASKDLDLVMGKRDA